MQSLRLMVLAPVFLGLAGCSYLFGEEGQFRERAMDYKQAQSIPALELPAGTSSTERKQRYPIPVLGQSQVDYYIPKDSDDLPKPQALLNVNEDAGVELRGDEDHHWLVVNQTRERLFPQVREFLNNNGFLVDRENMTQGTLETRWLKPRVEEEKGFWAGIWDFFTWGSDDERDRFQLTLSDLAEQASTVIEINHIRTSKGEDSLPPADKIEWPEQPEDPEMVLVMYNE